MPRIAKDKAYRNFANGYITEATGLTFPENSCRDIDNCDIELKGTLRRRLGLNQEAGGTSLGSYFVDQVGQASAGIFSIATVPGETCTADELAISAHPWTHPGGDTSLNFIIFQVGNTLIIRNWDAEPVSDLSAIGSGIDGVVVQLDGPSNGVVYNASNLEAAKTKLQSSVGFGRLFFVSKAVIPFYLEYDRNLHRLYALPLGYDPADPSTFNGKLAIRDFNGVSDGLKTDEEPTSLSDLHKYNLLNQGWGLNPSIPGEILWKRYESSQNRYPSNAQQWILGKEGDGTFDPDFLVTQDFGNSPAPKGKLILNALAGSRDGFSVNTNVPAETINFMRAQDEKATRAFSTVAFYAGRIWIAGDENPKRPNGVYFSKSLGKIVDSGQFAQDNDPTAEAFNELLATDGGVIYITEASNIKKLIPYASGLLAMADNGVWFIYGGGTTGGFTATNYSVEKVSSTGLLGADTVVQTDQTIVFFASNSVQAVGLPENGVIPQVIDIGLAKIFTYYGLIDKGARENANGVFDPISKKVFWSYLDTEEYNYPSRQSQYNRMLILDSRTGAFTKYSFTTNDTLSNGPLFPKRTITTAKGVENVTVSYGEDVTDSTGEVVVVHVGSDIRGGFLNSVKVLAKAGTGLRICEFYDTMFMDYANVPEHSIQDYESFVITGDEVLEDLQREKKITFLHSFFLRTETGVKYTEAGDLVFVNPSGADVVARWDWNNTGTNGRWSNSQLAYKYRRPFIPVDVDDIVDVSAEIVYTKLKIRGKGRSVVLRYSSNSGKDFQLLGFSISFTANGV